jgi:integrase/recombinase XerD
LIKKPNLNKYLVGEYKIWSTINFLLGTGCRTETLLNVKVEDINFIKESILFRHMKTRKQITVPLSRTLKTVLREYIQVMNLNKEDLLFPKLNGEKMK